MRLLSRIALIHIKAEKGTPVAGSSLEQLFLRLLWRGFRLRLVVFVKVTRRATYVLIERFFAFGDYVIANLTHMHA